jgi:hypothetical protein
MVMPVHAPASNSHALVTRMALALSGRHNPYTRDELRRKVLAFPIKPAPITVPWSALAR